MAKRSTKKALLLSVLSLVLCCALLAGTTFAWFTDSVVSMNNIIKSGSLDITLEYSTLDAATGNWSAYAPVDETTVIFGKDALYEPGYTEVVRLRVANVGSLAAKYQLGMQLVGETGSTNVYNQAFKLSDYIYVGSAPVSAVTDRAAAAAYATKNIADAAVLNNVVVPGFGVEIPANILYPANSPEGQADPNNVASEWAFVIHMPEPVGNEANHKSDVAAPEINFGVVMIATQLTYEEDTFDDQYDKDATYPAYDEASLKAAIAKGGTVELASNIAVDETIELTKDVTINLNGKTIATAANKARPFKITASDVDLVINANGGKVTFGDGTYGVIEIAAGSDNATVTVNGGTFEGTTDAGAFVKFRGGDNVQITLNDVTYTDNCAPTSGSTNAWVFNDQGATGSYELTVNGGTYTAANGFACTTNATFNGVVLNAAGAGSELKNATLTDCTFTLDPGMYVSSANGACVAVSNNGNVVVKNSTLTSTTYAFAVYSTGGTITAEGCNVTGNTFGVAEGFGTVTIQ